ncbi:MAG: NAD-dependent epimerase/dehydratase family protein [Deltaproteobacteria bacterium]|nr:NAD-dependent epimerase/dehydratase family protein [Deltaproteobacteria bacterium]
MHALVTGASGHLGTNLIHRLVARGHRVRALVRGDAPWLGGVERVQGDVLDPASLEKAVAGVDVVFHLAGVISVVGERGGLVRRVNVEGTRNVLAAAGMRRIVHMASIHAFRQDPVNAPLDETRPLADRPEDHAYDRSKAEAMRLVLQRAADTVVVAPTAVIGPYDWRRSRMGAVLLACFNGRLPAVVPGGYDWVDARDVAEGTLAAAERGRPGEVYLLGGAWTSVRALAEQAARVAGLGAPRWTCPAWLARSAAPLGVAWAHLRGTEPIFTPESIRVLATSNPHIDYGKAKRDLGYSARPLAATLEDTCRWFREAGRLAPGTEPL